MARRDQVEPRRSTPLPWRWSSCLPTGSTQSPKPSAKTYKLVDWLAEDTGLSRGKARRAIMLGRVKVDDVVELDADRMLSGSSKVELCPS